MDVCGKGRISRLATVFARERLPVARKHVYVCGEGWASEVLQWARANGCPWDKVQGMRR